MNEEINNPDLPEIDEATLRREVLIGRVIEGETSPEDWEELRLIAEHDPEVWKELNETQRQLEHLGAGVARAVEIADQIEIDDALSDPEPLVGRLRLVGVWGGWAAAACMALFWVLGVNPNQNVGGAAPVGGQVAGFAGLPVEPEAAFQHYLQTGQDAGRVIQEVPDRVVVRAAPLADGQQVEVFYLRQILEREVVDQVYREAQDELGNPLTIPVRLEPETGRSVW